MIATVILAAGGSRRLGRPKQMVLLSDETLLSRAVGVATEARLGRVWAVVNASDPEVVAEARRLGCEVVLNQEAGEGMASSIRAGVRAVENDAEAMLVMTCDQPAVSAEHLRLLADGGKGEVAASTYAGRKGVPALFPARAFEELLTLHGDAGARELLQGARPVPLPNGEIDVDTDEELGHARKLFETADQG